MSAYKPVGSNFSVTTGAASTASSPILHETQYLRVNTITADSYVNVATASSSGNDVAATSSNFWCSTLYPDVSSTGKPKSAQVVGITTEAGDGGTGGGSNMTNPNTAATAPDGSGSGGAGASSGGNNGYAIVTQSGSAPIYSGSGTKVGRTLTGADPNWPGSGA